MHAGYVSVGLIPLILSPKIFFPENNLETGEAVYYQARVHKEYVTAKSSSLIIITKVIRHTFVQ